MGDESARNKEGVRTRTGSGGVAPYVTLAAVALLAWAVAVIWALRAGRDGTTAEGTTSAAACIDLNSACAEELEVLPGVGPVLSRRIVEEREKVGGFRRLDDLLRVRGVTKELVERVRPFVEIVQPSQPERLLRRSRLGPSRRRAVAIAALARRRLDDVVGPV